jgi:hypothetical protein
MAANGLRLGDGGAFEILMFKFSTKFNRVPNAQLLPSAPLLPNRC